MKEKVTADNIKAITKVLTVQIKKFEKMFNGVVITLDQNDVFTNTEVVEKLKTCDRLTEAKRMAQLVTYKIFGGFKTASIFISLTHDLIYYITVLELYKLEIIPPPTLVVKALRELVQTDQLFQSMSNDEIVFVLSKSKWWESINKFPELLKANCNQTT